MEHTFKDDGVCLEVEKHHAPGKRDIDGRKQNDGLKDEHGERASHGLTQREGCIGLLQFLRRDVPIVPGLFPQPRSLLLEQNRGKCFYSIQKSIMETIQTNKSGMVTLPEKSTIPIQVTPLKIRPMRNVHRQPYWTEQPEMMGPIMGPKLEA